MLMYRSASFWTNTFAPELRMGIKTQDEVIDTEAVKEEPKQDLNALLTTPKHDEETGEIIECEEGPNRHDRERTELVKALMAMKVMRSDALKIVKGLSDDEVSQYLSDPASIEALTAI